MERKGVTAIISMVLMMLLVIAVFGGVYYWVTKFQKKTQEETESGAGKTVSQASGSVKYSFSVVAINDDGSDNIQITLRNDGSAAIRLNDLQTMTVKIDGKVISTSVNSLTTADLGGDENWDPTESITFVVNGLSWSSDIVDGKTHKFEFEIGKLGSYTSETCGPLDPGAQAC